MKFWHRKSIANDPELKPPSAIFGATSSRAFQDNGVSAERINLQDFPGPSSNTLVANSHNRTSHVYISENTINILCESNDTEGSERVAYARLEGKSTAKELGASTMGLDTQSILKKVDEVVQRATTSNITGGSDTMLNPEHVSNSTSNSRNEGGSIRPQFVTISDPEGNPPPHTPPKSPIGSGAGRSHYQRSTRSSVDTAIHSISSTGSQLGSTRLSKLKQTDLDFSEPVEKHVKTYMTSPKKYFEESSHVICLWHPFPDTDSDRVLQENYCVLGDVGIFNASGGFDVIFNIFKTMEENHRMSYFPPETFVPFESSVSPTYRRPREEARAFVTENFVTPSLRKETDSGIYNFTSKFKPTRPGGAILVAPEGCSKRAIRPAVAGALRDYIRRNVESWCDPDNYPDQQHDWHLNSGSLKLIYTDYKAKLWAGAAIPRSSMNVKQGEIVAELVKQPEEADKYQWNAHPSFGVTRGSSKEGVIEMDYTVAIEVYSLFVPGSEPVTTRPEASFSQTSGLARLYDSVLSLRSTSSRGGSSILRSHFSSSRRQ